MCLPAVSTQGIAVKFDLSRENLHKWQGNDSHLHDSSSATLVPAFNSQNGSLSRQPEAGDIQASPHQATRIVAQVQNEGITALVLC